MAGLWLCLMLTDVRWSLWRWVLLVLALSLCISILFWFLNPQINWYVGFSGVLFGLYVTAAINAWPRQRFLSSMLLAVIGVKIVMDMVPSVKIDSSDLIGVPVLADAHLYGVISALIIVVMQQVPWQSIFNSRNREI